MFKGGTLRLAFMAQDLFQGEKILAFDLETTGVSTNNDRIVQYALIGTLSDGTPVNVEQLVKPPVRIPYEASNIHGIYNEDVRDKPPLSEVADELAELIDGAILVGHNVRKFDYAMLKTEFLRMGRLAPSPKPSWKRWSWSEGFDCLGRTTSVRCVSDMGFVSKRRTRQQRMRQQPCCCFGD